MRWGEFRLLTTVSPWSTGWVGRLVCEPIHDMENFHLHPTHPLAHLGINGTGVMYSGTRSSTCYIFRNLLVDMFMACAMWWSNLLVYRLASLIWYCLLIILAIASCFLMPLLHWGAPWTLFISYLLQNVAFHPFLLTFSIISNWFMFDLFNPFLWTYDC